MTKTNHSFPHLILLFFVFAIFLSCRNNRKIPFPEKELGYTQPETFPLEFTPEKKLKWDTTSRMGIKPVVQKLEIDALPSVPYDSTGFKPFSQPPEEVKFDYNTLPGSTLDIGKLPSQSLDIKMSVLPPAPKRKIGKLIPENGKAINISNIGQFPGIQGQLIGALYMDKKGLLWIGGSGGLFLYDGENIETIIQFNSGSLPVTGIEGDNMGNIWFIQLRGKLGLINMQNGTVGYSDKIMGVTNNITKMTKDTQGNIWMYNTKDKAVSIINPAAKTYKNIDIPKLINKDKTVNLPPEADLQMVETPDKKIWISNFIDGVDIIDPASGSIKFFSKANGLSSDSIQAITNDKKTGIIWLSGSNGLDAVDMKNGSIKHYNQKQGLVKQSALDLFCDQKGQIWRQLAGQTATGIELIDPKSEKIRHITNKDGLANNFAIAIIEDNYQRIWIGTLTGLNVIDQYGETVHPLGANQIISLMDDRAGNLWVATGIGLGIINPQRSKMYLMDKAHGLTDNFVQSFWTKNGNMIVATDGGYNIFDPIKNTLVKAGKKEGLANDTVYTAFSDRYGNMWVTGPSNGIDLIDSANSVILHTDVAGGLSDYTITDIRQGKDGLIWLSTRRNGIDIIDPTKGTIKYLNDRPGLRDTFPRMLQEDAYGRMWIGTDKGIYVASIKEGTLTHIGTKQGLSNDVVHSLLLYNGSLVAATNNKVNIITPPGPLDSSKNWKVDILDKSEGLLRVFKTSWSTDWVTNKGEFLWGDNGITIIKKIQPAIDSIPTYITGINVMTRPQYFVDEKNLSSNDTIWTADSFYTRRKGFPPNTGYADDSKYKWESVYGPYNLPVNLTLPYNNNYLQFQFAQASLGRPDSVWYTYVLEGIDKNWSLPTTNTYTENYLNLPPGNYTFKVSSKDINGRWSKPASFNFTITPPWYQTWWAYALYILLGLGILRVYIVYRSRRLKKENRILEEKVKKRTEELQKSLEDLKATQHQLVQSEKMASLGELTAGIAHEIQNPLNFINNFSEVNSELIDELKAERAKPEVEKDKELEDEILFNIKQNLEKVSHHGKRADAIVKSMLQHSRVSSGQKELTDINDLCDEYLRLSYHGLRAKDKSFNAEIKTDFDKTVGKINIVPQDIGRVVLNLINNAFYAVNEQKSRNPVSYQPTVSVSTKRSGNSVTITVKDNGGGIPENIKEKIFQPFFTTKPTGSGTGLGLSLSYDIIKAHGGEIKIETSENKGSEFIIQLPVKM